jgi:lysophospholipase L1-like esterase
MARRSRPRSVGFRFAASLFVGVAMLGVLEAVARMSAPEVPSWRIEDNNAAVLSGSPTRLWGLAEGMRRNGEAFATINHLGLRGPDPVVPRPAGRQRILLVGDSSYFGHALADRDTIPVQLEAVLRERGLDVDVVNGAIPGYSTEQSKLLLEEVGWGVEPTLLLIANLWSDNNADGFRDVDLLRTVRVYNQSLLSKSALFLLMSGWVDRARGGTGAHLITWTRTSAWPEAKERRVPVQDYAVNLDTMVRLAREHGAGAALISPANKGLVSGLYKNGAGWDPYFSAQVSVAAWHGVPVMAAVEALQADPGELDSKFVDFMHPSAQGAGDIARYIADKLYAAGWPQATLQGRDQAFDASGVVDDARVPPGDQAVSSSPQAQLFQSVGDGRQDPTTFTGDAPGSVTPAPTGNPASFVPTPTPPTPGGAQREAQGWDVSGVVASGVPPFKITVLAEDGRPLGFTRISAPGPFSLHIRSGHQQVTVMAEAADGKTSTVPASKDGAEAVISL